MEPVSMIALANGILKTTGLGTWVKKKIGGSLGDKTADTVSALAQAVTNTQSPEAALHAIKQDDDKAQMLRNKILEQEHALILAAMDDVKNAREMYKEKNEMADHVANKVIHQNHLIVLLLIIANCAVAFLVKETGIALALGNLISVSIGALWQERQQIIGFYFGSSLGSKIKNNVSFNPVKKEAFK